MEVNQNFYENNDKESSDILEFNSIFMGDCSESHQHWFVGVRGKGYHIWVKFTHPGCMVYWRRRIWLG